MYIIIMLMHTLNTEQEIRRTADRPEISLFIDLAVTSTIQLG